MTFGTTVEELILAMWHLHIKLNNYDAKVVNNFYGEEIFGKLQFTEKQANLALQIINRYKEQLSTALNCDVLPLIMKPTFRTPPRKIKTDKMITIRDDSVYGRILAVEFPYNESIVAEIKKIKNTINSINWVHVEKIWSFPLSEASLFFLKNLAEREQFNTDTDFQNLANQLPAIIENTQSTVPMLITGEDGLKLLNVSKHVPSLSSTEIVPAVFESRKFGVTTWDDEIESYLLSSNVEPVTRHFLKSNPGTPINYFNIDKHNILKIRDIVKNLTPVLFIIPGGSELDKTQTIHNSLTEFGFDNSEISVLFRLSSKNGDDFNRYIRDNNLNSAISNNTRAVLISSRFPKTIVKTGIKFNCVISLGSAIVHYSIKDFIQSHVNFMTFSENNTQGSIDFGNM